MRAALIVVVVVGMFGPLQSVHAQGPAFLTDEDVEAALTIASRDEKVFERMSDSCTAGLGWRDFARAAGGVDTPEFVVVMTTTRGIIAAQAYENARRYLPTSIDDISEEAREDLVYITVAPKVDNMHDVELSTLIEHVVIRPRREDGPVFQPLTIDTEGQTYSNLFGASREVTELLATFSPADVASITDEDDHDKDLDVIIIASHGEQSCHLNKRKVREALNIGRAAE